MPLAAALEAPGGSGVQRAPHPTPRGWKHTNEAFWYALSRLHIKPRIRKSTSR